ncbi:MAG TPA: PucR family transcriptional regulator [Micromonosporaceae bacterium]|nr:PucR family transcriptional regulator [Micromonosporaceae bacterium]
MPMTLRRLLEDSSLDLRLLVGGEALERQVTWVHSTELADPTPFLTGGELLLTTGVGGRLPSYADYVARLRKVDIAALGFGTGLRHDVVPEELVDAAAAAGLPLLQVPRETPFIAISKAVSRAVSADEYAAIDRVNRAQQTLTRDAVDGPGLDRLVSRLARLTRGWVLLLSAAGEVLHAAPETAASYAAAVAPEVERLRASRRVASAAFQLPAAAVAAQTLGVPIRGFLVVGRQKRLGPVETQIVNIAAALAAFALERSTASRTAEQRLWAGLFELALAGQFELAKRVAAVTARPLPEPPVRVFVLSGQVVDRRAVADRLDATGGRAFLVELPATTVALVRADAAEYLRRLVAEQGGIRIGMAAVETWDGLATGYRQAREALDQAQHFDLEILDFADLVPHGVLELLAPAQARAFADSLLAAVPTELVESLQVWLAHHGQWEPAAAKLSVHRHTLRNRMRRVEQLIGRSLDSAGTRAELWLALCVETGRS